MKDMVNQSLQCLIKQSQIPYMTWKKMGRGKAFREFTKMCPEGSKYINPVLDQWLKEEYKKKFNKIPREFVTGSFRPVSEFSCEDIV